MKLILTLILLLLLQTSNGQSKGYGAHAEVHIGTPIILEKPIPNPPTHVVWKHCFWPWPKMITIYTGREYRRRKRAEKYIIHDQPID